MGTSKRHPSENGIQETKMKVTGGEVVTEKAHLLAVACPIYLCAMCFNYGRDVNQWANAEVLLGILATFIVGPMLLATGLPRLIRILGAFVFLIPMPFLYDITNDNFGRMIMFSGLAVGFFRAIAIVHTPRKWPTYAHRAICTVTLCQLEQATRIPRGGKLKEAARRVGFLVLPASVGFAVHRSCLAYFTLETLNNDLILNSLAMGLFATCALHGLDGLYGLMFVPLGINLPVIQDFPVPFSTSLQDFWGRRWNTSVSDALRGGVHRPLKALIPNYHARAAISFLASAVLHTIQMHLWGCTLHEVIATCFYFVSQAALMFVEDLVGVKKWRSLLARRLWTFTILVVSFIPFAIPLKNINTTWNAPVI